MSDDDPRLVSIQDAIAARAAERAAARALPPVDEWHPARTADVAIRIGVDGQWYYQGTPIRRARMVRLFSSVLRVDEEADGTLATYLVTPAERLRITVDDAPFTAIVLERHGAPDEPALVFTSNVGERIVADREHPIEVEYAMPGAAPRPYLHVRGRLRALISRAVFMELASFAEARDGVYGVVSRGVFMPLGPMSDEPGESDGAEERP